MVHGFPLPAGVAALLRHPATVAVRVALRDAIWRVRGAMLRNPRIPERARTVLFVCKGNICRSAFAATVSSRILSADTLSLSAGLDVKPAASPPEEAMAAARRRGLSLSDHRAGKLTSDLMACADVVLVMEPWHATRLRTNYPAQKQKIHLLALYDPASRSAGSYERLHIVDPYGKSAEVFDECFSRIERAIAAFARSGEGRATL